MKPTFNQLAASILAGLDLIAMVVVYFVPVESTNSTNIIAALTGSFGMIIMFLVKASSDASNADRNNKMIDALKDSAPVKNL